MKKVIGFPRSFQFVLILFVPVAGMALGVAASIAFNLSQPFDNLLVNLGLLTSCIGLSFLFGFSRSEAGIEFEKGNFRQHVFLSLLILLLYLSFYVFVVRISGLKPFTADKAWGLVTFLVVAIAEELYFRGIFYGFIERHWSGRAALVVSSILFGLFHARQGVSGMLMRTFAGWLWGSVRYSTGMIFLVIFLVHLPYNSIWLLFNGNWDSVPSWAGYLVAAVEFSLGLAIVLLRERRNAQARSRP